MSASVTATQPLRHGCHGAIRERGGLSLMPGASPYKYIQYTVWLYPIDAGGKRHRLSQVNLWAATAICMDQAVLENSKGVTCATDHIHPRLDSRAPIRPASRELLPAAVL